MSVTTSWFILGAGLSPYTLDLWEKVASKPNQQVTLAYVPQRRGLDFAHEGDFLHSDSVELVPVESARSAIRIALRCVQSPEAVVVCMGYSPIYNLAISAVLRRTTPNRRLFYMSDTNGVAAAESAARSIRTQVASLVKWLALGSTFSTSLDLGFSNRLAHRSQGIAEGVDLPLLAVDFPTDMKSTVPAPISPALASLPAPRILTIARLAAAKNLTTLASAFSDACQRGMPGSLTIVGEGPERYKLERLVAQADGRVVLAGAIPFRESRRVFGAYDAMVLASLFEPWAIAIIEALGWGLPVLSSRECGAGISMAMEVGDAVKLCGTSHNELRDGLMSFVQQLGRHSIAAKKASLSVRRKFGLNEVADALVALASSPEAVVKRY